MQLRHVPASATRRLEVAALDRDDDRFVVTLAGDAGTDHGDYILLAGGKASQSLAEHLGATHDEAG